MIEHHSVSHAHALAQRHHAAALREPPLRRSLSDAFAGARRRLAGLVGRRAPAPQEACRC